MKIIWMEYAGQPMICDFSCGDDVDAYSGASRHLIPLESAT